MLNEIQEAYEYMYDLSDSNDEARRLNWSIFMHNDDMNGLERMLTDIARFFLFEDEIDSMLCRLRAEAAMRMWLGFTNGLKEDTNLSTQYLYLKTNYPHLDHWLQRYLKEAVKAESDNNKVKLEKLMEQLSKREKQLGTKSLTSAPYTSDYKLIRYDKIISNAIVARGSLKKYYLVCAFPEWKTGTNKITGKNPDAHIKAKDEDKILKLIAAYLLERNRKKKSNDDYVPEAINFTDISSWAAGNTRLDSSKFKMFTYEDSQTHTRRPLFEFYNAKSGNMTKVLPDREWLEYCGWDIIEATYDDNKLDEYLKLHAKAIYFSDPGACRPLMQNIRYIR